MDLKSAMEQCKVRGYIFRRSDPNRKFNKNSFWFKALPFWIDRIAKKATDWEIFDPEIEATESSLIG